MHEQHQDNHHAAHEHDHGEHDHGHGEHGHDHGEHGHEHHHHHHGESEERSGFTGKVHGLVYDRVGDFDGFLLDTEEGEQAFDCREPAIGQIISRAWAERILITVFVDAQEPWRPARIVLRA